jgi:hypothetical protein
MALYIRLMTYLVAFAFGLVITHLSLRNPDSAVELRASPKRLDDKTVSRFWLTSMGHSAILWS